MLGRFPLAHPIRNCQCCHSDSREFFSFTSDARVLVAARERGGDAALARRHPRTLAHAEASNYIRRWQPRTQQRPRPRVDIKKVGRRNGCAWKLELEENARTRRGVRIPAGRGRGRGCFLPPAVRSGLPAPPKVGGICIPVGDKSRWAGLGRDQSRPPLAGIVDATDRRTRMVPNPRTAGRAPGSGGGPTPGRRASHPRARPRGPIAPLRPPAASGSGLTSRVSDPTAAPRRRRIPERRPRSRPTSATINGATRNARGTLRRHSAHPHRDTEPQHR